MKNRIGWLKVCDPWSMVNTRLSIFDSKCALFWNCPNEGPWRVDLGVSAANQYEYGDEKDCGEPRGYKG